LLPLIQGKTWKGHNALFFEHEGNRAVRQGNWKLVSEYPANQWHLYNIVQDRSETNDLAAQNPDKVKTLTELYEQWANRIGVIPFEKLDKRKGDEF
jgi:arylsulfatase